MATKRSAKRMQALGYILSDGLVYSWFECEALDYEAVTATLRVNTGDFDANDDEVWKTVEITADDVARGLRMYREMAEGKREEFPGQWKMRADGNTFCRAEGEALDKGSYAWELVRFDRTNGDEGDYDANTADAVLQFATLGYAIYS